MNTSIKAIIISLSLAISSSAMANDVVIKATLADIFGDNAVKKSAKKTVKQSPKSQSNKEPFIETTQQNEDNSSFDEMANNIQECQYLDDKVKQSEIVLKQSDDKLKKSEENLKLAEKMVAESETRFQQAENLIALADKKLQMIKKTEENIKIIKKALQVDK